MAEPLEFHADGHRYTVGGRAVPGVTSVLRAAGILRFAEGVPAYRIARALSRGTAVHLALALRFEDTLDPASVHPDVEGYLYAWDVFASEHYAGFVPEAAEVCWYDPTLGFAGQPDVVGTMRGTRWLLDVKCGPYQPGYEAQVAAYRLLARANGVPTDAGGLVLLRANGTFQLRPCEDRYAEADFRAALHLVRRGYLHQEDT
jgi:hypothetical protein